ncbi:MAG: phosphate acyltransferase PlsX [Gammaproteobacteria bacterium]|nr:phosphate acyltransferase PlsX [Gammaproteobacteria bacterium]
MEYITLSIDAMGGDHGLSVIIPASINALKKFPQLKLILVGHEPSIKQALRQYPDQLLTRCEIHHAPEVVEMNELPSVALRTKKASSMRLAINLVKEEKAQAVVSAGNTGALMATARFVLKTMPGIDRPAIIAELPNKRGKTRVIDLGANVDSCAEHLFQFAVMGSALIQAVDRNANPKIGVLNIGVEEIKGNDQVKHTAYMLSECKLLNYIGYVEGDHLYLGDIDLIVCDGFVGNVALKASEGLAKMIMGQIKQVFSQNAWTKCIGLLARPILKHLKKRLDPARYNGATLIGLNGIVIKSHGSASILGFQNAIEQAMLQVQNNVVHLVRDKINDFMNQGLIL